MIFSRSRIIGLVLTIATLGASVVLLQNLGAEEELNSLLTLLQPGIVLILFLLYGLHFIAEPVRWKTYTALPAFAPDHGLALFRRIFACFNITALLSYSLPMKLGIPIRVFLLCSIMHLNKTRIMKLMAIDVMLNLFCWGSLTTLLFILLPEVRNYIVGLVNLYVVLVVMLLLIVIAAWIIWLRSAYVRSLLEALPLSLVIPVVITLFADVLFYGVRHATLANFLAIDISLSAVFIIGIIATFAGIVSALPMGLGAYDASLVAMLGLYGVGLEQGLVLALCNRLCMVLTSVILGLPSVLLMLDNRSGPVNL